MRLIDADEFEKRIKPYDTEDGMDKALYNFAHYHLVTTPSAQPMRNKGKWIPHESVFGGSEEMVYEWCTDCKEYDHEKHCCPRFNRVIKDTVDEVKQNAQPMRKWIEFDSSEDKYDVIKCPCCKHIFTVDSYHWTDIGFIKDDFKFCPNCGANMREGGEE